MWYLAISFSMLYDYLLFVALLKLSPADPNVSKLYTKLYEHFMEEIDAIDNGVEHCTTEPRYFFLPCKGMINCLQYLLQI